MGKGISRWRVLGRVLLFFLACAFLLALTAGVERQVAGLAPGLFIGAITSLGTLALTAVFVRWEGLRLNDVGAAIEKGSSLRFLIGFILGLLLVTLHMSIEGLAGHLRWARTEGVGLPEVATALLTYFLLSCREELAFHGYPLQRLKPLFGLWVSQLIVALVFALEHVASGSTWVQAVFGAAIGSLLFGMAAIVTKGLAVPIGLHAAWNLGDWMHGGKDSRGLWHAVGAEVFRDRADRAAMIGYVAVMVSATLGFWLWYRRGLDKTDTA